MIIKKPEKFWDEVLTMTQYDGWRNFLDDMKIQRDSLVAGAINARDINHLNHIRGNVEVLNYLINLEEIARATLDQLELDKHDEGT